MNHRAKTLSGYQINQEVVPVERYLKMSSTEKAGIRSTQIAPPTLGSKGFGGIIVRYKTPIYRVF